VTDLDRPARPGREARHELGEGNTRTKATEA
jgi:hypothetical protein